MSKKKLTLTQSITGWIPTALIVTIMIYYAKKHESENYQDINGTYFGYLRTDNEEPLLFKLEIKIDSLGNYLSFNDSKSRYYIDNQDNFEVVRWDKSDPYIHQKQEITLKITQHRAENVINWHETNTLIDVSFGDIIYFKESEGELIKKSDQLDVFQLN